MGKETYISWTHHTFNPWWGCVKVSLACMFCYAETWAKRCGQLLWGKDSPRRFFGDKHWREPLHWNSQAEKVGERRRVFCASMADVFEDREDLNPERIKLWKLISDTPWLDWLLLTKRPENVLRMVPWGDNWPSNVWMGTTVENQEMAEKRIPILMNIPARVRFLSCEPLLGRIDLTMLSSGEICPECSTEITCSALSQTAHCECCVEGDEPIVWDSLNWIICGGESGPKARTMNPNWLISLRDQCVSAGVPFHFKQWGEYNSLDLRSPCVRWDGEEITEIHFDGKVYKDWECDPDDSVVYLKVGKLKAGRTLQGKVWDEFPEVKL